MQRFIDSTVSALCKAKITVLKSLPLFRGIVRVKKYEPMDLYRTIEIGLLKTKTSISVRYFNRAILVYGREQIICNAALIL